MSATFEHACSVKSTDPRKQNTCGLCGRPMPEQPASPVRDRDVLGEAQMVREASRGVADPEPLIAFTQLRALRLSGEYVTDPMKVRTDRPRRKDAREEAADGVNHLVWELQDPDSYEDDDRRARDFAALQCFVRAYDLLREEP